MNIGQPEDPQGPEGRIDRAWRGASTETPPPHVDAAILAAARAPAKSSRPWQPFAAAAAVAGLAFVLVQLMPVRERTPSLVPPVVEAPSVAEAPSVVEAPPVVEPKPATVAPNEAEPSPVVTASPAADSAAAVSAESSARSLLPAAPPAEQKQLERAGLAERPAPAPAPGAEPLTPDTWARQIVALHDAGSLEAAAAELQAFRAAVADADQYLPDRMKDWAASVD